MPPSKSCISIGPAGLAPVGLVAETMIQSATCRTPETAGSVTYVCWVVLLAPQQSPPPRESMGMAFDELHQQTVVFGGLEGFNLLNGTWVLQTQ